MNPTVLETLQTYRAAKNPVNLNIPQGFHMFCTCGPKWKAGQESAAQGLKPASCWDLAADSCPVQNFPAGAVLAERLITARNGMAFRFVMR